jgi:hypothetical protein
MSPRSSSFRTRSSVAEGVSSTARASSTFVTRPSLCKTSRIRASFSSINI